MTLPTLNRAFYVPAGAAKFAAKDSSAVVHAYQRPDRDGVMRFYAVGFRGKAQKPAFRYQFLTEALRADYVGRFFAGVKASEDAKAKRKAKARAAAAKPHGLAVGDVFYTSWGYEQTNVNFYQVVGLAGARTVELREIGKREEPGSAYAHGMACMVVPAADAFVSDEVLRKRVSPHMTVKVDSCETAYFWDGKPKYCSWYA
ncbi:MAG: hypothetical protein VYD87_17150 [Pseudomonadota bacterium]|nr:hypothetical protein [Pseudomonadota bacterium]